MVHKDHQAGSIFPLPEALGYGIVLRPTLINNHGNHPMSAERQVYPLKVDSSGRIVLPSHTRQRLNVTGGDTVVIVEDESGVHLKTRDQLLAEAQAYFASFVPRGVLLSDEVNADRRSEIERD